MAEGADNKTEKPTGKRLDEARKKGQVARSMEINSTAVLLFTFVALSVAGPKLLRSCLEIVAGGLGRTSDPALASPDGLGTITTWAILAFGKAVAPVVFTAMAAGLLASVLQVRPRLNLELLKPSLAKLNPATGLKRLVSPHSLVELAKSVVKTVLIGGVAFSAVWPHVHEFAAYVGLPPDELLAQIGHLVFGIAIRVSAALVVVAAADYAWQRRKLGKDLMMTKDEVKQEARQTDLPPEVRGAIRRKQMEQARKRMMAEVPTADVVVVNPTHFAVALRYDGSTPAPEVIAKGVDIVALAIRRIAEESGVTVVHEPPLARALYRDVEIGELIPDEFFAAVAEVLAFVFRTAGRRAAARRRRPALTA